MDDFAARLAALERRSALADKYLSVGLWSVIDAAYRMALPHREISCIVCGHTDKRSGYEIKVDECIFGGGELERYVCPTCDCIFGPMKYLDLDEKFVDLDYRKLYASYQESDSSENERRTFYSLQPHRSGPYLDWGCGGEWSPTVKKLRDEGFDVWGFEPSAETSGQFVVHTREAISARFAGIFSNNVIEHFRRPIDQFKEFYDRLLPNAKMAHSSPCYEYSYAYSRFHTLFLLGRSAEKLGDLTGFKMIDRTVDSEYINVVWERL